MADFGKEFGRMAQGETEIGTKGTHFIFVMSHDKIANISEDCIVTYTRIVVDYRPQKKDPNIVCITTGEQPNQVPQGTYNKNQDLTMTKILWNSTISTDRARYICWEVRNFYFKTPMDGYKYMKIPLSLFPEWTIKKYDLCKHANKGWVFLEIKHTIYGLHQAGMLAKKWFKENLSHAGYYEVPHTPGLWKHVLCPILFFLVVDDFGIKHVGKEHAKHLILNIRQHYGSVVVDWNGELYVGITLK